MMYTLDELLVKMGAPETKEKGQMRWHYFDGAQNEVGGFAEVRLLDNENTLVAEMKQLRHRDDETADERFYTESLFLHARRAGSRYEVTKIAFDGEEYSLPQKSIIELGLSIFHARALDISILMIEQAFNRDDILQPVVDETPQYKNVPVRRKKPVEEQRIPMHDPANGQTGNWGVVVPFRPRTPARSLSF